MARTQKNKATAHHMGMLKAKLAKLRRELITPKGSGGASNEGGFDVAKTGDARIGLVGMVGNLHYSLSLSLTVLLLLTWMVVINAVPIVVSRFPIGR
jgi:ribosome-interacting GTPase 1